VKSAVIVLFLMLTQLAYAESQPHHEYSFFSSLIQMLAALSIVIGLILLTRYFSAKFFGNSAIPGVTAKNIRLIETRYLSPKKSLILVEVAGEYLLLANTDNQLSLIKQINMVEEIGVVDEPGNMRTGFSDILKKALRK